MYYTVRRYDTLGSIAGRFGVSVGAIMHANRLRRYHVYPGMVLYIPVQQYHHPYYPQHPYYPGQQHHYGHGQYGHDQYGQHGQQQHDHGQYGSSRKR